MTIIIIFWILYPTSFANFRNFSAILRNLAFEGILAIGMMIMLVGGNFDHSVGSMESMIGVVTGALMKVWNWPVPLAVATGLLIAALGGFINGFIVAKVRVNALITTLGTMGIFQGIALLTRRWPRDHLFAGVIFPVRAGAISWVMQSLWSGY